jgi:hypothetical protein
MKNKMTGWMVGGFITVAVLGVAFGVNSIGNAAAKTEAAAPNMMMQNGHMSPDMMNSPEMQKQCGEMMTSPEMQKTMMEMMQQPPMQSMMKQMMASDPAFKQMMFDLVTSAADENTVSGEQAPSTAQVPASIDHNAHHKAQ